MSEPPIDPPDDYWGETPEQDDDREPVPGMDDWDVQDWQDAGVDW